MRICGGLLPTLVLISQKDTENLLRLGCYLLYTCASEFQKHHH
jgi:hypothetical protein